MLTRLSIRTVKVKEYLCADHIRNGGGSQILWLISTRSFLGLS
jgi:hypothetical protein